MSIEKTATQSESGFTLIELLVTIAILSILASLAMASFILYKESAEYSKGSATLHNARIAYNVGELELPDGFTLAFTESASTGGDLAGPLAQVMPGTALPEGVRLGVEVMVCDETSGALDRAAFIVSEPCRATKVARWQKFCGGIEILQENLANPAPCT